MAFSLFLLLVAFTAPIIECQQAPQASQSAQNSSGSSHKTFRVYSRTISSSGSTSAPKLVYESSEDVNNKQGGQQSGGQKGGAGQSKTGTSGTGQPGSMTVVETEEQKKNRLNQQQQQQQQPGGQWVVQEVNTNTQNQQPQQQPQQPQQQQPGGYYVIQQTTTNNQQSPQQSQTPQQQPQQPQQQPATNKPTYYLLTQIETALTDAGGKLSQNMGYISEMRDVCERLKQLMEYLVPGTTRAQIQGSRGMEDTIGSRLFQYSHVDCPANVNTEFGRLQTANEAIRTFVNSQKYDPNVGSAEAPEAKYLENYFNQYYTLVTALLKVSYEVVPQLTQRESNWAKTEVYYPNRLQHLTMTLTNSLALMESLLRRVIEFGENELAAQLKSSPASVYLSQAAVTNLCTALTTAPGAILNVRIVNNGLIEMIKGFRFTIYNARWGEETFFQRSLDDFSAWDNYMPRLYQGEPNPFVRSVTAVSGAGREEEVARWTVKVLFCVSLMIFNENEGGNPSGLRSQIEPLKTILKGTMDWLYAIPTLKNNLVKTMTNPVYAR